MSFRDELYSQYFYKSLYKLEDLSGYIDACSSLVNLQLGSSIKIICPRFLKYLKTIYKATCNPDDTYDVCLLLNYWVYSRLFNILKIKGVCYVHIAYGNLQRVWSDFLEDRSYPELCKPINEMVSDRNWR
ncbi:hypothetical protein PCYB_004530 [Plasmodium cynomolgi strain B]|uniref:CYIR protein n=1 Tax=Plasmodium cynomolgi (strain B) TaxID=1120755 RepID=K6V089_PLACD|nr:hypothetical protein PCYB_004530 [Plasmodium cynomolgi strain B]GAB69704.1 hypothetical protein PCYB_004530 [Plasmodium cynomolgi strain B]